MGKIIKLRDARNREQIQFLCVSLVLILLPTIADRRADKTTARVGTEQE